MALCKSVYIGIAVSVGGVVGGGRGGGGGVWGAILNPDTRVLGGKRIPKANK